MKRISSDSRLMIHILICTVVVFFVLLLDFFNVFDSLESISGDMRFRIRGVESHTDQVVIVGIDPQTLHMMGWIDMPPRSYHAELIENLYKAGARAVLFDFLFLNYTGRYDRVSEHTGASPSEDDLLLAQALSDHPSTVIGRKLMIPLSMTTGVTAGEAVIPPALFAKENQLAFVDMYLDSDSFVRRTKLFSEGTDAEVTSEKGWNYSFALKAAMLVLGVESASIDTLKNRAYVGDRVIPLDKNNFMTINFPMDEKTYHDMMEYVSYEQVLDDSEWGLGLLIEKERFKDKVVLVGATWPQSGDFLPTPFYMGTRLFRGINKYPMYGVHVHKAIISTIVENRFIHPIGYGTFVLLVLIASAVTAVLNLKFGGLRGLFLTLALAPLYFLITVEVFVLFRRLLPFSAPSFGIFFAYIGSVTYNFLSERKQKAMIKGAFSQYVPASVVSDLLKNPEKLKLGGEERVMSVLFSDIADFTTLSESLTPTELVEILNEYLTLMTDIIFDHKGIIDKYEGDAIMAEFGAPLPDEEHAANACLAALHMQRELEKLRGKSRNENKPLLYARIGVNSGPMVIGNMGSKRIFDYTVIGDNVNLGSRLEGANKVFGSSILISENTRKLAEHAIITRELGNLQVKGKTESVMVHELLWEKGFVADKKMESLLDVYNRGMEAYRSKMWNEATEVFRECLEFEPSDTPSKLFHDRCAKFCENPPSEDFHDTFTMSTK